MKLIDCFTFYNEIDLLNYRLNILDEVVDYFVIVEGTHTYVGKEKEMYFEKNKENLFKKFTNKIIHIIVDDFPYKYPNINTSIGQQWENEIYQRNRINDGIQQLKLDDKDIIMITDVDEIPNIDILHKIKNNEIMVNINTLEMDLYYYNLNWKQKLWSSARILQYKEYKLSNLQCNNIRMNNYPVIKNGGWHLSYFGDSEFIKNKIENFSHQELNIPNFTNINKINDRITSFTDMFDRNEYNNSTSISVKDNNNLPPYYDIYLTKFILF
jgi:beta-1,4-mannosyl-glycoprotein beta-1,4-N-acetylglucosaminyltransferase